MSAFFRTAKVSHAGQSAMQAFTALLTFSGPDKKADIVVERIRSRGHSFSFAPVLPLGSQMKVATRTG